MSTTTFPFTLTFTLLPQVTGVVRPALQSFSSFVEPSGNWFMVGGRRAGLHQFRPGGDNFPAPNQSVWHFNPNNGSMSELVDLTKIDPAIGDPLMATNQQSCYDADAGEWLIAGGYGYDSVLDRFRTFDTLIRIPVVPFAATMNSQQTVPQRTAALEKLVNVQRDPFFAVTGGSLRKLGGRYLLAFGQWMDQAYDPFRSSVEQRYVNAVRFFRFDSQRRAIGMGELTSPDLDKPFHRRDGTVIDSIDPATGGPRVCAFGGVFPPGMLDGYKNPVYVTEQDSQLIAQTDRSVTQLFNQYGCPVIVVWNPSQNTVYQTFFAGISRSWYWQTAEQNAVYQTVTGQGRNDGMPFVCDISTLVQTAAGGASEYIWPAPVPGNVLAGASTDFIPVPAVSNPAVSPEGIVDLSKLTAGQSLTIGYIYGGIIADFPLPKIPNYGTHGSNDLYQVVLTYSPSSGYIPSSQGNLANGVLTPAQKAGVRAG